MAGFKMNNIEWRDVSSGETRSLRDVFGSFMTGVTVVTAWGSDGAPRGFTANSFTSVSLDPALVLVCIAKNSNSLAVYSRRRAFRDQCPWRVAAGSVEYFRRPCGKQVRRR
ncbi:flavin reductase family protein [Pseudomonas sp. TH10]|uniref:flavin reductase family protein n=1 Tax=Pseudomonas sp. TH10 TaxID=2796376 RepID=UPI0035A8CACA